MSAAIGMIEVEGVAPVILAADVAVKTATVDLLGWETIGGFTTVFVAGTVSDVTSALDAGEAAARTLTEHVVAAHLSRPEPECRHFVSFPVVAGSDTPSGALGLIETRGYGIHILVNDHMVKSAPVDVFNVLTVQNRIVCSLILGEVDAVREAVQVARALLSDYEHLLGATVISRPDAATLQAFGRRAASSGRGA